MKFVGKHQLQILAIAAIAAIAVFCHACKEHTDIINKYNNVDDGEDDGTMKDGGEAVEEKKETPAAEGPNPQNNVAYAVFKKYDVNGDNRIDVCELQTLCMELGAFLSPEELRMALRVMDVNGDGGICFPEFERWWMSESRFDRLRRSEEELKFLNGAFGHYLAFDKDMDGCIDHEEFRSLHEDIKKMGLPVNDYDMDWVILDQDRNGWVSFNEFVDWIIFLYAQLQQPNDYDEASAPCAPPDQ